MNYRPPQFPQFSNNYNQAPTSMSRLGQSNRSFAHRNVVSYQHDENLGEVQFMLENQRKKFKEAKEKFQYDLDVERKLRIQFENKLIKVKDQMGRKDVNISELQFKINNFLHQNQDLSLQNDRLHTQLTRLQSIYTSKINQLEQQLQISSSTFQQMQGQYNSEFQKFKKQGQQYVESIQFEYDRKIKNLQEKCKQLQSINREFVLENKKLNDILVTNKLAFQEEIRDLKNKCRDQEIKKVQGITKSYQHKVRLMDEAKETLSKRNSQLVRTIQDKDRQIEQINNYHSQQLQRIQRQNSDFSQKNSHLSFLLNKVKSELADKENQLSRYSSGNDQQAKGLRQQLEQKKQEQNQMSATIRELRGALKEGETEWERKRKELVERNSYFEQECRKYKDQYQRICEILKSRINETINNVTFKK